MYGRREIERGKKRKKKKTMYSLGACVWVHGMCVYWQCQIRARLWIKEKVWRKRNRRKGREKKDSTYTVHLEISEYRKKNVCVWLECIAYNA